MQSHAEKALLFISGKRPIRLHFSKWSISVNCCLGWEMMPLTAILHRRTGSGLRPRPAEIQLAQGGLGNRPLVFSLRGAAERWSYFVGLSLTKSSPFLALKLLIEPNSLLWDI